MHISEIINPVNLLFTLLASVGTFFCLRKVLFDSLEKTVKILKDQNDTYEKTIKNMRQASEDVKEKDRLTERRMLAYEAEINRFKLQTHLHREEIEMVNAVLSRCMPVILAQANGQKAGIEDAMRQIIDFRSKARQQMIDFDDTARNWRIFAPDSPA